MDKIIFDELYGIQAVDIDGEKVAYRIEGLNSHLPCVNFLILYDIQLDEIRSKGEKEVTFIKQRVRDTFQNILTDQFLFIVLNNDRTLLFMGFGKNKDEEQLYKKSLEEIFKKLQDKINNVNSHLKLSAGVSSLFKKDTVFKRAYQEAYTAKEMGRKICKKEGIFFYDDLGIYKFLRIPDKEEVLQDKDIRCIYEYDREHNANLIDTLEAFMDSNGRIKETARKVFAHPNTVKYRLSKIRELAGEDILRNEDKRLYYYVMVKAIKLISD